MDKTIIKRKRIEKLFKGLSFILTWSSVLLLIVLIFHLLKEGLDFLSLNFLSNFPSRFVEKAGMKAGIYGSLWLITLTGFIAIPVGILSALYFEEYGGKSKFDKVIEVNINNLAGVPSIVYGLLGLTLFVRYLELDRSIIAGAMTLSLLILPVIIVSSRESIKAVPNSIREAAFALGVPKYCVVFFQVLPVALPGILTGVILTISRAIGETAPLIVVGALAYISYIPESIMDEFTVMPIQIYNWANRPKYEFHQLAASGILVLLVVMLVLNSIAVFIRHKSSKGKNL